MSYNAYLFFRYKKLGYSLLLRGVGPSESSYVPEGARSALFRRDAYRAGYPADWMGI